LFQPARALPKPKEFQMKKITLISLVLLLSVLTFVSSADSARIHSSLVVAVADLSISKVDTPDPVNTGSNITYTITVTNDGPDAATNASWTDTLPSGTSFVSLSSAGGWGCTQPEVGDVGTVSCSNPSFAVGSAVFTLIVKVSPSVPAPSTITNSATVTSSTLDSNTGNQTGTATTAVLSPASVGGNKSVSGGSTPGSTLTYLIQFVNGSNSDQQDNPGNELTDVLPADLTLVSADSSAGATTVNLGTNTVNWNGVIPAHDSVTLTITATIKPGTVGNTISNHGTFSYDADGNGTNETNLDTNTVSFVVAAPTPNADLGVTKVASADTLPADSDLTYTITVTNNGPDTAVGATLSDTFPGNLTFVSLSQPAGWTCSPLTPGAGGTLSCSRDLSAGSGPQVFTLVTHIPSGTSNGTFYNNVASVTTTTNDPVPDNNSANAGTTVGCLTGLVVTTNADSGPGSLRQAITDACADSNITFSNAVSSITLSSELVIDKGLTIQGPGASLLTISGNTAVRVFNVTAANTILGTPEVTFAGVTISNGKVTGAKGGGILNSSTAIVNVTNSVLSNNTAGSDGSSQGGGIANNSTGTINVTRSTVSNNSAGYGAGLFNNGTGTINVINSTLNNNPATLSGGGIYNNGTGTVTVTNSTLSANSAGAGGGIFNVQGTVSVTNVTVSNNSAPGPSGAGGGIYNNSIAPPLNSKNSIIALNTSANGPDLAGTFNSQDYNLIGNTTGATINGTTTHNINNTNPNLGTLANNGGPTQTMLPLPNSPAINAGDPANLPPDTFDVDGDTITTEALPLDQRGFARVVGANFDIGSVETNYVITATAGTPQNAAVNTAFPTALKVTVTESGTGKSGISVTFTALGSGASGTFPGPSATAVVTTDAGGVATAPNFTANASGGSYNVIASIGTGLPTATFALTNNKLSQTITFAQPADKTFGGPDFTVTATATSGLVVSFTASGNCTVTGTGTVHITGAGSCTITASQTGNATYNAAPDVLRTFNIAKAATSTTVTSSVNPSNSGQSVTFTATVSSTAGTPTGTVQFKDNGVNLGAPQALNGSGVAQLTTSSLTVGSHPITADYSGDGNFNASTGSLSGGQTVGVVLMFSSTTYNTTESSRAVTITVQRIGDSSQAVTVDYATPDDSSATPTILPCSTAGFVSPRCDFTTAAGTLKFATGETSKTFEVLISQDNYVEGNESFSLTLSNPTNGSALGTPSTANVNIADDVTEPAANPIDDSTNFVRQHYHDFLNREPLPGDAAGLNFWVNQIEGCGSDQACRDLKRINVSGAFFLSIEFQQTGFYVYRTYKAGLGDINPPSVPVPLRFREFVTDTQEVQRGVVVGQGAWQAQLDANKQAYALAFVTRTAFLTRYPGSTSATSFVDTLNANAGNVLNPSERAALISELTPNPADPALRGDVLMKVAENAVLKQQEMNRSFVLMQYFGYLRRNPDAAPEPGLNFAGYNFWVNKLNQFNGNFVNADMVKAFITSSEYRKRFGQ
jgi:uncharacterized repeat protein (TIGR01451 family)